LGIYESKLRFFGRDNQLVLTDKERATTERLEKEAAQQRAETERLEKEAAQRQVEELKRRLRDLGADPDAAD
jgi:RNA 3'-terminal phosphate cyclase